MRIHTSARPAHVLAGVLLAAALAVTGCSGGGEGGASASDGAGGARADVGADEQAATGDAKQGAPGGAPDAARSAAPPRAAASHVIRTASLTVRVKDVPKALEEVRTTTENAGGYIGDETTNRDRKSVV